MLTSCRTDIYNNLKCLRRDDKTNYPQEPPSFSPNECLFLSSFSFLELRFLFNAAHNTCKFRASLQNSDTGESLSSLSPPLPSEYNLHDRLKLNDFKLYHCLRESSKADTCSLQVLVCSAAVMRQATPCAHLHGVSHVRKRGSV